LAWDCRPANPLPLKGIPTKNRLRELRAARRWSQADLADRCQVSRQAINAIETERYDPSLPLAFTIAHVFDRTIEEIFQPDRVVTTNDPTPS
jgi:putative transcriptional regulator